jgi:hypothetical protein
VSVGTARAARSVPDRNFERLKRPWVDCFTG